MPNFEESEGFKLKSGNKTSFKEMGSIPVKHLGSHPSKKDGHTHKGQGAFQRIHGALTGTEGKKFKDTKVGKAILDPIKEKKKKIVENIAEKGLKKTKKTSTTLDSGTTEFPVTDVVGTNLPVREETYGPEANQGVLKPIAGPYKGVGAGKGEKFALGGGDPYQYRTQDKGKTFQYKKIGETDWNDAKGGFDKISTGYQTHYPQ